MYKSIIRPILFCFDPEKIHHFIFACILWMNRIPGVSMLISKIFVVQHPALHRKVFGIDFPNPVGLAAGFDKDAKLFNELSHFGFGFIEVGTLTPVAQAGNPKPRMFRLAKDSGLINRMGFNNEGVTAAAIRLKKRNKNLIIGGNIGKNKITENENAVLDYEKCFEALFEVVDYFVVNVSSPNTPNLRALQEKEPLKALLHHLQKINQLKANPKPIALKIAPDLTNEQLDDVVEIMLETKLAGLIATNTTIDRSGLQTDQITLTNIGAGGLSGKPLRQRATEVIQYLSDKSKRQFPIIAVGGIHSAADALEKLNAGASLIQLYTGFVYEGPALIKQINQAILNKTA